MTLFHYAARQVCSPPPCGEGLEVGVGVLNAWIFRAIPPSLTSKASFARLGPHKKGGNARVARTGQMRVL
jgi:hypothetical protein